MCPQDRDSWDAQDIRRALAAALAAIPVPIRVKEGTGGSGPVVDHQVIMPVEFRDLALRMDAEVPDEGTRSQSLICALSALEALGIGHVADDLGV